FGVFVREMKNAPAAYLHLYLRKIYMFFNGYEIPGNLSFDQFLEESFFLKLFLVRSSFIIPLGILGLILLWPMRSKFSALSLFFIVLSFGVIVFHIQSRYRIVVMPYFILFAAYALRWLMTAIAVRQVKILIAGLSALLIISIFTSPMDFYIN